jgi:hypothetical protein
MKSKLKKFQKLIVADVTLMSGKCHVAAHNLSGAYET